MSRHDNDEQFMKIAFNKAFEHLGSTNENPSVGCVVVKNNSIISSGKTAIGGRPHAEENALKKNINVICYDCKFTNKGIEINKKIDLFNE